jgi:hypothetical protein
MLASPLIAPTRRLSAPEKWDHAEQGLCHTLEILDHDGWMISAWTPSEAEIKRLLAGSPVLLMIKGTIHPVVALDVAGNPA